MEVKTGTYIMYVGKSKPKKTYTGLESAMKYTALGTHLKTHKAVRLVEVEYTGANSVNEIREVVSYAAIK